MDIKIIVGTATFLAELNDTPTALKVAGILPFRTTFDTWGEEIYFPIHVTRNRMNMPGRRWTWGIWATGPGQGILHLLRPHPHEHGRNDCACERRERHRRVKGDPAAFKKVMHERDVTLEEASRVTSMARKKKKIPPSILQTLTGLETEMLEKGVHVHFDLLEAAGLRLKGGMCKIKGEYHLFIDRRIPAPEKIDVLRDYLARPLPEDIPETDGELPQPGPNTAPR